MSPAALEGLDASEWRELCDLMGDARHVRLSTAGERRLRDLLARRHPRAATMEWDDLVHFGLVVLGGYFLYKALA